MWGALGTQESKDGRENKSVTEQETEKAKSQT